MPRPGAGAGDVAANAGDFVAVLAGMAQAPPCAPVTVPLATADAACPVSGLAEDLDEHSAMLPVIDAWQDESAAETAGLALPVDMAGFVTPHSPPRHLPEAGPQTDPQSGTFTADQAMRPADLPQAGDVAVPLFSPAFQSGRAPQPAPPTKPPAVVALAPESKVPADDWESTVHATQNGAHSSKTEIDHPETKISGDAGRGADTGPAAQAEALTRRPAVTLPTRPEMPTLHAPALRDDPAGQAAAAEKTPWFAPALGQDRPLAPQPQPQPQPQPLAQNGSPDAPPLILPEQGKGSIALPNPAGAGMQPWAKPDSPLPEQPALQTEKTVQVEKTMSEQRSAGVETSTSPSRPSENAIPYATPLPLVGVADGSRLFAPPSAAVPFPQAQPALSDSTRAILRQIAPAAPHEDGAVEIALFPKGLGRVRLELHQGPKGAQITVSADRPETLDLIRRHSAELIAEFRAAGMSNPQVSFAVDVGQSSPLAPRQDAAAGPLANGGDGGSSQHAGQQSKGSPDGQPDPRRTPPLAASLAERTEPSSHPYRSDPAQSGGLILRL